MKTITSFGGPFIALNRKDVARWDGVFGKGMIGAQSTFGSDYEAACSATGRANLAFDTSGFFRQLSTDAFLIAPPVETALISIGKGVLIIAQVEAAEEGWSFDTIDHDVIAKANFYHDYPINFGDSKSEYLLFDSSVDGQNLETYLTFIFDGGTYSASSATYDQDGIADINLYMFSKRD